MTMKTIENPCTGGGKYVRDGTQCPDCGLPITVNRSGTIRKHEGRSAPLMVNLDDDLEEPVHSVSEMREGATKLKIQLRHTYEISKDPRFKRLWQHALALEIHLTRMSHDQAYGSASVQLAAYEAGDAVGE